jgi:hypothetical protein
VESLQPEQPISESDWLIGELDIICIPVLLPYQCKFCIVGNIGFQAMKTKGKKPIIDLFAVECAYFKF